MFALSFGGGSRRSGSRSRSRSTCAAAGRSSTALARSSCLALALAGGAAGSRDTGRRGSAALISLLIFGLVVVIRLERPKILLFFFFSFHAFPSFIIHVVVVVVFLVLLLVLLFVILVLVLFLYLPIVLVFGCSSTWPGRFTLAAAAAAALACCAGCLLDYHFHFLFGLWLGGGSGRFWRRGCTPGTPPGSRHGDCVLCRKEREEGRGQDG